MNNYESHRQEKLAKEHIARKKRFIYQIALWLSIIVGIGLIVGGMIYFVSRQNPALINSSATIESAFASDDWIKGNKDAKTILIEYSDFQCPACAFYYPLLKKISEEFGDNLAIVYRHFPLPNHQGAKPMAYAAEAAGKQGKFWEMHDMIFDNQSKWVAQSQSKIKDIAVEYAKSLELNIEQFEKDFGSKEIEQKVEGHYRDGIKAGINSTPTFFLNGQMLQSPRNYDELRNIIIQAIDESR